MIPSESEIRIAQVKAFRRCRKQIRLFPHSPDDSIERRQEQSYGCRPEPETSPREHVRRHADPLVIGSGLRDTGLPCKPFGYRESPQAQPGSLGTMLCLTSGVLKHTQGRPRLLGQLDVRRRQARTGRLVAVGKRRHQAHP